METNTQNTPTLPHEGKNSLNRGKRIWQAVAAKTKKAKSILISRSRLNKIEKDNDSGQNLSPKNLSLLNRHRYEQSVAKKKKRKQKLAEQKS